MEKSIHLKSLILKPDVSIPYILKYIYLGIHVLGSGTQGPSIKTKISFAYLGVNSLLLSAFKTEK